MPRRKKVKVEADIEEDSDVGYREVKAIWRGRIGGREMEIGVGPYSYVFRVGNNRYYFSAVEDGFEYLAKEILRLNLRDNGKMYNTLEELFKAIREEYYKLRVEISEALGGMGKI